MDVSARLWIQGSVQSSVLRGSSFCAPLHNADVVSLLFYILANHSEKSKSFGVERMFRSCNKEQAWESEPIPKKPFCHSQKETLSFRQHLVIKYINTSHCREQTHCMKVSNENNELAKVRRQAAALQGQL